MSSAPTVRGNRALVDIFQTILIPEFRRHGKHRSRTETARDHRPAYFDPWWWPMDPADEPADWGVLPDQQDEFRSLCDPKPGGNKLPGFVGSLGASKGCVWIIGERPSFDNRYGNVIRYLRQKLQFMDVLPELAEFLGGPPVFHVTDLLKFRGNEGRAKEDLCCHMIDISVECLQAEFEVLEPAMILITDFAECLVPFVKDKLSALDHRLDGIINHPMRIVVPYWSREPHDGWAKAVASRLRP